MFLGACLSFCLLPAAAPVQGTDVASGGSREGGIRGRPTLGKVVDAAGRPWAGVHVLLHGRPYGGAFGREERIEVVADARGRFRVHLRRGWRYAAWGYVLGRDGRYRVTNFDESIVAGRRILLAERLLRLRRPRLRVTGRVRGLRLAFGTRLLCTLPVRPTDGRLPPSPVESPELECLGVDGEAALPPGVRVSYLRWNDEPLALGYGGERVPVTVKVVGGSGGQKPLAGALVELLDNDLRRPGGPRVLARAATGRDGLAHFRCFLRPAAGAAFAWSYYRVRVTTEAAAERFIGLRVAPKVGREPASGDPDLTVAVHRGGLLRGRVLRAGRPVAGRLLLWLDPTFFGGSRPATFRSTEPVAAVRPDPQGRFALQLGARQDGNKDFAALLAFLPENGLPPGPAPAEGEGLEAGRAPESLAVLFCGEVPPHGKELGEIDLGRLPLHALSFVRHDGEPAAGTEVVLEPASRLTPQGVGAHFVAGRRGRLVLAAAPGARGRLLALAPGGGLGIFPFPPKPKGGRYELAPARTLRGRVVDGDGRPVPGAKVWFYFPNPKEGMERVAVSNLLDAIHRNAVTDRFGRFAVHVPAGLTVQLTAVFTLEGRLHRGQGVRVPPGKVPAPEDLEFVLELPDDWPALAGEGG